MHQKCWETKKKWKQALYVTTFLLISPGKCWVQKKWSLHSLPDKNLLKLKSLLLIECLTHKNCTGMPVIPSYFWLIKQRNNLKKQHSGYHHTVLTIRKIFLLPGTFIMKWTAHWIRITSSQHFPTKYFFHNLVE